jgi:hypothetical protein
MNSVLSTIEQGLSSLRIIRVRSNFLMTKDEGEKYRDTAQSARKNP